MGLDSSRDMKEFCKKKSHFTKKTRLVDFAKNLPVVPTTNWKLKLQRTRSKLRFESIQRCT